MGASTEFKWLSCFDSLIIQMKGLAGKKDNVPDSCLWIILFLHFWPVSHLWMMLVWKPIITEFHVTKSLWNGGKSSCIIALTRTSTSGGCGRGHQGLTDIDILSNSVILSLIKLHGWFRWWYYHCLPLPVWFVSEGRICNSVRVSWLPMLVSLPLPF